MSRFRAPLVAFSLLVPVSAPLARAQSQPSADAGAPTASQDAANGGSPRQDAGGSPAPSTQDRPPFDILRQEENWSALANPKLRRDDLDNLKYIPFGKRGFLTLGGQMRQYYEYLDQENFGDTPFGRNGFLLQRYMLHSDLRFGNGVRAFAELKSGQVTSRDGGPRPTDRDDLDFNQAFLEVGSRESGNKNALQVALRVGRQELNFGAGRYVSVREGPNVRVGFDGVFGIAKAGGWRVDAFVARPVETNFGAFDDDSEYEQKLRGVYATGPLSQAANATRLDVYYLNQKRRRGPFFSGVERERRQTVGVRVSRKMRDFDLDLEPAYQFGSFGQGSVRAWSIAADVGYNLPKSKQKVRLSVAGGLNSGDRNPNDNTLNTFSPPAPRGRYFGQIPSVGPQNVSGFSPAVRFNPAPKLTVTLSNYFFFRQSRQDGLYTPGLTLLRPGNRSRERYIGSQPNINLLFQIDPRQSLTFDYAQFLSGRFLEETPPGRDVRYFAAFYTFLF